MPKWKIVKRGTVLGYDDDYNRALESAKAVGAKVEPVEEYSPAPQFEFIIPSSKEREKVKNFIDRLKRKIARFYQEKGIPVRVQDVGSTAKGTFVRGDFDVDIYVLTDQPEKAYELAKVLFPHGSRKYGELLIWHFVENHFDVDLVFAQPGYVKEDTLKHSEFFKKSLTPEMKREVVKAKAFFKTKGLYGAEIGGITGVALEELIRKFGTFERVCKYLSECKEKPFLQDPVLKKPRNLLASITPRRWRQIQQACRDYLATRAFTYKPFSEEDFRRRYRNYVILEFARRKDKAVDFHTAQSVANRTARLLRNLEPEASFESDVYVTDKKVLVALKAHPSRLSKTKKICIHKKFIEAVENFRKVHPQAFEEGNYICAVVPRKFVYPLTAYIETVKKRMRERGYQVLP